MTRQRGGGKQTALVTGAGRGLGLATAHEFAKRGHHVLLTARDASDGAKRASALAAQGLDVAFRRLDVSDRASIAELARALEAEGRTLDVLVNNAGVAFRGFDAEIARRTLDVNFFGALEVTRALLPRLSDGGNVVMVSSGLGELSGVSSELRARFSDPDLGEDELCQLMNSFVTAVEEGSHEKLGFPSSAYRVSKVGLNALTRILARELAGRRISVNAVCPGWVRTDMGGSGASRSIEEGTASIVWAALCADGTTGGFFRDGRRLSW